MKWEYQIYLGIGFLIFSLLFLQSYLINREKEPFSEVNSIESFNQVLVAIECNIFIMEGERQNILVEGPEGKMNNIETINNEGCITIRGKGKKLLSRVFHLLNAKKEKINIYITFNNLDEIYIDTSAEQPDVKYSTEDMIGLTLENGNTLILESKKMKNCQYLTS
jgi:hypothetical protein